nr:hypothetical protein [Paraburkholderia flava]
MNRVAWRFPLKSSFVLSFVLLLSACADGSSTPHRAPPQDPPDYHGVPTDTRPPSMIVAPDAQ